MTTEKYTKSLICPATPFAKNGSSPTWAADMKAKAKTIANSMYAASAATTSRTENTGCSKILRSSV